MTHSSLLVTGGAGFVGSSFVHYWANRFPAHKVVVLDALTYAGRRENLAELEAQQRITFVHGDIADGALVHRVLEAYAVDLVVHFAAESHVDRSIASADAFVHTNVLGTQRILDAVRAVWCANGAWRAGVRFHHISTDEVFGDVASDAPAAIESSPYAPSSPYAASKAAADHLVRAAGRTHGLPYSISHCANNYGPRQYPEKLIPLMLLNALHGRALPVYGDGLQRRAWLHVDDHAAALARLLTAPENASALGESFNIGGTPDVTNASVVATLCEQIDARFAGDASLRERFPDCPAARGERCVSLVTNVGDRPGHDRRYAIDATKFAERFGVMPTRALTDGLSQTVQWYLAHAAWWGDTR
jgi:dTDP-glucose 4,6-dehydratase